MNKGVVKIRDMFKIDNEAAVGLKKAVFGQYFQPILHIVNGFKIPLGCMYGYLSAMGFHCHDIRSRKGMYALPGFNGNLDCCGTVQFNCILHITEKTFLIQRL